jgi:phytoene dehydrogenase-like protein
MSKHYDVVVLGASVGALATAALLARRSWRVVVLGQGFRPAVYTYDGLPLARRPFTFLAASSPAWRRVLIELAQSQSFRRHARSLEPQLQLLTPRLRLSVSSDPTLLGREIDREFPEVRRVVDELAAELARTNQVVDAAFEQDVVWPPGTFWERRETARAAAGLPDIHPRPPTPGSARGPDRDLLAEFPREHMFRAVVETPARFASDLGASLPVFALARLYGAWTRGVVELARGEADLVEFLVDRVQAHGGEARLGDAATHVTARYGNATGVRVDGDDDVTGVQFVVTDLGSPDLLDLATEYRPSRRALDARPSLDVVARRFVTSLLVRDEGVPEALATEAFLLADPKRGRPEVHLQKAAVPSAIPGTTLLVAETLVGAEHLPGPGNAQALDGIRAAVVATVEAYLPYVERHYLAIDSPHDGLPLWDHRSGRRVLVERPMLRAGRGSVEAEAMEPVFSPDRRTAPGPLVGEPLRYPLGRTFGVGKSVLPALGQEGQLLAAWSVARTITRTDRRKEKMRREMWSKVDLG